MTWHLWVPDWLIHQSSVSWDVTSSPSSLVIAETRQWRAPFIHLTGGGTTASADRWCYSVRRNPQKEKQWMESYFRWLMFLISSLEIAAAVYENSLGLTYNLKGVLHLSVHHLYKSVFGVSSLQSGASFGWPTPSLSGFSKFKQFTKRSEDRKAGFPVWIWCNDRYHLEAQRWIFTSVTIACRWLTEFIQITLESPKLWIQSMQRTSFDQFVW